MASRRRKKDGQGARLVAKNEIELRHRGASVVLTSSGMIAFRNDGSEPAADPLGYLEGMQKRGPFTRVRIAGCPREGQLLAVVDGLETAIDLRGRSTLWCGGTRATLRPGTLILEGNQIVAEGHVVHGLVPDSRIN